ncbi:hypothetical protein KP509_39G018300 [Ceratopteris richardii]|nr:hypothetical protein KP509_39G018300 [Ceratopteris richardii]
MEMGAADPVLAPELQYCHLPIGLPDGELPFDCCAPNWDKPAIDFQLNETAVGALRIRRAAHTLDAEYAEKLDRAYGLMKALPSEDPRSFTQQANIHCAYCSSAYQMGNSTMPLQVHASWLFFSFHRWYLYFHERILASLLGDDTFALPFWNYDHPDGMTIPHPYMAYPNLTDTLREPSHLPPAKIMLDYYYMNASIRTAEEQVAANLAIIYRMVVSGAPTQYRFFGQPYRKDDPAEPGYGTMETMPHNSVHGWTGDQNEVGKKDMGTLYAAGRDPVFYAHHASLDRFWDVWKSLGNDDIDDPDYLNSEFVFYNENAELIKVKVKDSLDSAKLGYVYEDVENVWLNWTTPRLSDGVASLTGFEKLCVMGEDLTEPCSLELSRDKEAALIGDETLLVEGIEGALSVPAHFEAFVNLPVATRATMINCTEYAGRFSTLAQNIVTNMTGDFLRTSSRFSIGSIVDSLELNDQESLVVTLVPNVDSPYAPVRISNLRLQYETEGLSRHRRQQLLQQRARARASKLSQQ